MEIFVKPLKLERKNGFFSNLHEASSVQQLRRFTRSAGLTIADNAWLAPYTVQSHGVTEFVKEATDAIKRFFSDTRVVDTTKRRIEIGVTELHCPRATGVKAKLSVVRETEETEDCSVEIFGIGGGDEYKTTFSVGNGLETSDGACIAVVYSVVGVFESCEIDTPDRQVRRFVRLKELEEDTQGVKGLQLVGSTDACQTSNFSDLTNIKNEPFNLQAYGKATYEKTLSVESGSTWKGEVKVELEKFGIKLGASYQGKTTNKTDLAYTLVGGFDYLAIKPTNHVSWLWRVTP